MQLQEYDFTIEHRKGSEHGNADGLSRQTNIKKRRRCGREECDECDVDVISPVCVLTRQAKRIQEQATDLTVVVDTPEQVEQGDSEDDSASDIDSTGDDGSDDDDDLRGSNWCDNWDRTELREMQHHDRAIHRFIVLRGSRQKCPNRKTFGRRRTSTCSM